jgi:hypothetical protein
MASVLNVLTRPKRSIHSRKLVITEELAQLIGKDYNSESDEEFLPEKSLKKSNTSKNNVSNGNDEESESEETNEETSDESESLDDDDDDSKISNIKSEDEKICEENKIDDKKKVKRVKKLEDPNLHKIKKKEIKPKDSVEKKKQKREYNKRKKLHQLKVDELKDENNKILEKLSSRVKPTNKATINNGPMVRLGKTLINDKSYPMYIVSSGRNVESTNIDIDSVKIPKEKILPITDPTGQWSCKLCLNRPNYENLGDLYGPYFINENQSEEEIWFHENCIVWTPNVYIKDNKLMGAQDAISLALKNVNISIIKLYSQN